MLRSGRRKQPNQAASLQQCELAHDMKWSVGVSWHLGRKGIDCNPRGIDCAIGCATACATDCGNAVDMRADATARVSRGRRALFRYSEVGGRYVTYALGSSFEHAYGTAGSAARRALHLTEHT